MFNINFKFEVMVSKTDIAAPRWNSEISVGQPSGKARDFRTRKDTLNLSKSSGVQVASFAVLSTFGTYCSDHCIYQFSIDRLIFCDIVRIEVIRGCFCGEKFNVPIKYEPPPEPASDPA